MLFKKRAKACTVYFGSNCQHWFGGGGGGGGPIDFVSACQMMLKLQLFPRVLSKIVAICDISRKYPLEIQNIESKVQDWRADLNTQLLVTRDGA